MTSLGAAEAAGLLAPLLKDSLSASLPQLNREF